MLLMPFNVIAKVRSVKTSYLNNVIAQKVGSSSFVTEEYLNNAVASVIEKLMEEKEFNDEVIEGIYESEKSSYFQFGSLVSKAEGYIYSELLDSTKSKFSYV